MATQRWGWQRFESGMVVLLRLRWKARPLVPTIEDGDGDLWWRQVESGTGLSRGLDSAWWRH
jgi:hypothetical protein